MYSLTPYCFNTFKHHACDISITGYFFAQICANLPNCTVRRTLLNSAPTNACHQPDSAHKRKIPLAFVLLTQSKFPFALHPERKIENQAHPAGSISQPTLLEGLCPFPLPQAHAASPIRTTSGNLLSNMYSTPSGNLSFLRSGK